MNKYNSDLGAREKKGEVRAICLKLRAENILSLMFGISLLYVLSSPKLQNFAAVSFLPKDRTFLTRELQPAF